MALNKEEIAALIPHGGSMVLLDAVDRWDQETITCRTGSHRDEANPLRRGRLSVLAGIEYAAQAMALHGALTSGQRRERRVLGTVRDVHCCVQFLDDLASDLLIDVRLLGQASVGAQYAFSIACSGREVMTGQATVFST